MPWRKDRGTGFGGARGFQHPREVGVGHTRPAVRREDGDTREGLPSPSGASAVEREPLRHTCPRKMLGVFLQMLLGGKNPLILNFKVVPRNP